MEKKNRNLPRTSPRSGGGDNVGFVGSEKEENEDGEIFLGGYLAGWQSQWVRARSAPALAPCVSKLPSALP